MGRWDRFYEARSVKATELLLDELVKEIQKDLASWPPPVLSWTDAATEKRFEKVLAPDCPKPSSEVYRTAFRLAAWELERNYEALDEFARNDRASKVASTERDRLSLELLHRWLTDLMLEMLEVTRLARADLVGVLQRAETRLLGP